MKKLGLLFVFALAGVAFGDDIDDIRSGVDLDFDVKFANYTYTGVMSGSGSVLDGDAPATQAVKAANTLNMNLNAGSIFPGANIIIPLVGSKLSPTQVQWTTDSNPNVMITVVVQGTPTNLLVTRIWGQLKGNSTPEPLFYDAVCNQGYNVRLDDTASNTDTWLNVNTLVNGVIFLPINMQLRDIDYIAFGGVPRGELYSDSMTIDEGFHFGGTLDSLRASDNQKVIVLCDADNSIGQLSAVGHSAAPSPGSITVRTETSSVRRDISQFLEAYNYKASAWDFLEFTTPTPFDQVRDNVLTSPGGIYVQTGTREMKSRITWIPNADMVAFDGWTYSTDQLKWLSAP